MKLRVNLSFNYKNFSIFSAFKVHNVDIERHSTENKQNVCRKLQTITFLICQCQGFNKANSGALHIDANDTDITKQHKSYVSCFYACMCQTYLTNHLKGPTQTLNFPATNFGQRLSP